MATASSGRWSISTWAVILLGIQNAFVARSATLDLQVNNRDNVLKASQVLADAAMGYYQGDKPGQVLGLLPPNEAGSYNWWQGGALWGEMIEYWYYTGDDTYNKKITDGMLNQIGPDSNYEPLNQSRTEGNDDQAFWAFAAMSAAETKFPDPPTGKPSWLSLAQAVFNRQASRWDDTHCNGGLRWQFNPFNNGYMSKNTISNGCFFQLAARLARYTKNDTYAQWADKTYEWMTVTSPLITKGFEVYDSIGFTDTTCETVVPEGQRIQWTYNIGTMIAGAAFMYNHTNGAQVWKDRIQGYLDNTKRIFFPEQWGNGKVMTEYACEPPPQANCNPDQRSFKTYLSRWLAVCAQLAPWTQGQIMPWLQDSAMAASKACTLNNNGVGCGRVWFNYNDDGLRDVGNQMSSLSVVQSNLILGARPLADLQTGDSASDPGAGGGKGPPAPAVILTREMTVGDKAGAWILTAVALLAFVGGAVAMVLDREDNYAGFVGGAGPPRGAGSPAGSIGMGIGNGSGYGNGNGNLAVPPNVRGGGGFHGRISVSPRTV